MCLSVMERTENLLIFSSISHFSAHEEIVSRSFLRLYFYAFFYAFACLSFHATSIHTSLYSTLFMF